MAEGIRKRGSTYSFRINVRDPQTGIWKNIERGGFPTITQAKQARAVLLAEYEKFPTKALTQEKKITLGAIYDEFINRYAIHDREKSTIKKWNSIWNNHLIKWEKCYISRITANELSEYLFSLAETHSHSYIMSIYKTMKVLWYFAFEKNYIKENVIVDLKAPKPGSDEGQIKIYTQKQLDEFEKRFASTQSLTGFKIGRATGVRCGECYGLLWSDIDWEKHTMKIERQMVWEDNIWTLRRPKTPSAIRVIDLQDDIYNYLKEVREKQLQQKAKLGAAYRVNRVAIDYGRGKPKEIRDDLDLINVKDNGELLTPSSEKFLGRISRKELSVPFKYHNLRHTHASWLAEHGVPAIVTKKRLGHAKEETTLRYYTHITQGMRDDLLEKLNSIPT